MQHGKNCGSLHDKKNYLFFQHSHKKLFHAFPCYLLAYTTNSQITNNNMANNDCAGIFLYSSSNNSMVGNNLKNNDFGVLLVSSSNYNTISGNSITNNWCGIRLYESSNNNSISGNDIEANNAYGIYLYFSSNNKFYHNNFVDNTNQVYSYYSANVWDYGYPSGGNYWSDYIATANDTYSGPLQNETENDGIADTSYEIGAENTDNYPLMGMFSIPEFPYSLFHHYS